MSWSREYFVLKTASGEAIGLASRLQPVSDCTGWNFTLWLPEHSETNKEFVPVTAYSMEIEEYTTHRDAFETLKEVEIVREVYNSTNTTCEILVRKKDESDPSKISHASE